MSTAAEDAESVDQFLARIASLKDRRDREDEERIRKVEEEILQGRKERQARRAERARSISPSKSSPAPSSTATTESRTMASRSIDPPVEFSPPSHTQTPTRSLRMEPSYSPQFSTEISDPTASKVLPTPPQKSSSTPAPTAPTVTSLARNGTLSWQQRPSSRDSNASRSRPQEPATTELYKSETEEEMSRIQIAKSLGSKDPTFFKQTADRGVGSAAYRRSESERGSDSSMSRSMRLPGMSQESSSRPKKSPGLDGAFAKLQLPMQDVRTVNSGMDGPTSEVQSSAATPGSSSPLSTPRLAPSEVLAGEEKPTDSSLAVFPGWASSRRPPSPTKGLGGFVESAMMKRSDSVSKRWSVQAAPGLKRGDSIASSRGTVAAGPGWNSTGSPPRQTRSIRPLSSSSPAGSRPTSSHDLSRGISRQSTPPEEHSTNTASGNTKEELGIGGEDVNSKDTPETGSGTLAACSEHVPDHALPANPTKTMDARRWSPTKSSWLESALARPESPKTLPSKPDEPAWKSSMHKSKTSTGNPPPTNFEVNTTSLLRSPPMGGHSRPLSISGLPESFASGLVRKSPEKSKPAIIAEASKPSAKATSAARANTAEVANVTSTSNVVNLESPREKSLNESGLFVSPTSSMGRRDPPPVKAKPATPPKTDFRSALKSRQIGSSEDNNAEPEFKAVFGKLKRTQTKNYVAPDELKDNITKGKAALNLTGGPQKPERVDVFKESILQKKEAMKEGTGLTAKPSIREKPVPVVPEALAKKEAIKAGTGATARPPTGEKPAPTIPEALAKRQLLGKTSGIDSEPRLAPVRPDAQPAKLIETKRQLPSVQKIPETAIKDEANKSSLSPVEAADRVSRQAAAPPKQELANSKLASRLNPALAGFLSRGASPKPSSNNSPATSTDDLSLMPSSLSRKATDERDGVEGAALTHMTKARAKGPKRRAPKAEVRPEEVIVEGAPEDLYRPASKPVSVKTLPTETDSTNHPLLKPAKPEPTTSEASVLKPSAKILKAQNQSEQQNVGPNEAVVQSKDTPKGKPAVLAKSPELRKVSSPTPKPAVNETPASPIKDRMRAFDIAQDGSQPPANKPMSQVESKSKPSTASPIASPLAPSTTRLNSPRSSSTSGDMPQKPAVMKLTKPVSGLGLDLASSLKEEVATSTSELTPPPEKPQQIHPHKSFPTDGAAETESKAEGKLRGGWNTKAYLADFFDQHPKGRDKADFDTQAIMSADEELHQKVKTLSMSIWEITGNGKKESMPAQQEHILFEDSMYLCVHTFQPENGSKSNEAHLWVGDAVPEAAVEDAQLFCRKFARENSAKLEVLKQGKETANFFQALGGIVITRRKKRSALYMLCGRRHLGHIAFDEVDLEPSNLCSGFPYIVSAKFGKLFLWKGRGSGADELGCARLIGMDLGLTGEIEEINDGEEPKTFWESFVSKTRSRSSDLWELKATQDAFLCRLYRVELDRPKSAAGFWGRRGSSPPKSSNRALVEEISPFCQGDLNPHHIYLLDAYFNIYVYVGDHANAKTTEFATALLLAQEMSMLAPTLQDRPLMPATHVVFGDPPRDFKAVLRKWEDERHEQSVVLPLDEAIEALE